MEVHLLNISSSALQSMRFVRCYVPAFINFVLVASVVIDSSGIRLFYSSMVREYEAGLLVAGHRRSPFLTIPPNQAEFNVYGLCSAECIWNVSTKGENKFLSAFFLVSHIFNAQAFSKIHMAAI